MSQELITANAHILAYQSISRELFKVFSEGPGGTMAIKFSANDPKHKEWLNKAEAMFAKQTEIKPVRQQRMPYYTLQLRCLLCRPSWRHSRVKLTSRSRGKAAEASVDLR